LYVLLLLLGLVFASRLFFLQILRGDSFVQLAQAEQLKKYEIPAERGRIYLREAGAPDGRVPVVLNENRPTLYADPRYVKDPLSTAQAVASVLGGDVNEYQALLADQDRYYVVLAKKLSRAKAEAIAKLQLDGIGLQDYSARSYPEGDLAAQVLGFVNDEGAGQYGLEGALDKQLAGEPGLLRAVTDVRGIPLTTSEDAILKDPVDGDDLVLSIDRSIQSFVQDALERGVKSSKAKNGSAVVMDPASGAVLAMANYPSYNPAEFAKAKDPAVFVNGSVAVPYEVGSVVKPFTMAAGLNEGVLKPNDTYHDPGYAVVDGIKIENAHGVPSGTHTMSQVIQQSVNSGVIHVLKQLSGGQAINQTGRNKLFEYFDRRFGFTQPTGIEQAAEADSVLIGPNEAEGNNVRYANMTFGQGMSLTMLQLTSAFCALVNGGDYYQPYLIHSRVNRLSGEETLTQPKILRGGIISEQTSGQLKDMMEQVVRAGGGLAARRDGYRVGGKTGTSQKLQPDGTYSDFLETGSFIGYGAGDKPQYVVMVKIDEPAIGGFAGSVAAAPLFAEISNFLIDHFRIAPVR
jgi:cell division protein FtsI/penicillin-binding protein 2